MCASYPLKSKLIKKTNILDQTNQTKHTFLTGYTDHTLKFDYMSCPDKCVVPEELWAPNQPNNKNGIEPQLGLNFNVSKDQFGFNDIFGGESQRFLCMVCI
jgi:hypothetical protein